MQFIKPNWPVPSWIRAYSTLRQGGVSKNPYNQFNLGDHVGDVPGNVYMNRLKLQQKLNLIQQPYWLNQTHSNLVINIDRSTQVDADGAYTTRPQQSCIVMTADCLPVLITNTQGTVVAAVHCGWRGMQNGILKNAITAMQSECEDEMLVWLGPAIGPDVYEVGPEVRDAFIQLNPNLHQAFVKVGQKYNANLYKLAKLLLNDLGVNQIYGGEYCTYSQSDKFYSFRRDKVTGRMASLIWIEPH